MTTIERRLDIVTSRLRPPARTPLHVASRLHQHGAPVGLTDVDLARLEHFEAQFQCSKNALQGA